MNAKIVFTGGHHNSALSVALELKKQGYGVFWLGHKYSMWGDKNPSGEFLAVTSADIPFFELKAGKFYKTYNPLKLLRIPRGFFEAFYYLRQIKPDLIVSFGGYLAVPVALCGWILKVPVITHEQTSVTGLSNRLIGIIATRILLTFPSSQKYFARHKSRVIGLPIADLPVNIKADKNQKLPQIFITGGKQGAHAINTAIFPIIPELTKEFLIIHQTGSSTVFGDFDRAKKEKSVLQGAQKENYRPEGYLSQPQMYQTMTKSFLVIGRSGAHTVYELGIIGVPSLLIPIPWVVNNEQQKNAEILKKLGSAEILPQRDLNPESLLKMIKLMMRNIKDYERSAQKFRGNFPLDARDKMVEEIKTLLPHKPTTKS